MANSLYHHMVCNFSHKYLNYKELNLDYTHDSKTFRDSHEVNILFYCSHYGALLWVFEKLSSACKGPCPDQFFLESQYEQNFSSCNVSFNLHLLEIYFVCI